MTGAKKQTGTSSRKLKKSTSASKKSVTEKQKKVVSLSKTRPTKKELKAVTEKTIQKFSVAIKKLSQR